MTDQPVSIRNNTSGHPGQTQGLSRDPALATTSISVLPCVIPRACLSCGSPEFPGFGLDSRAERPLPDGHYLKES